MYETDLFGDVVVTVDDIKLWLHHVVSMTNSSESRIEYYIKYNDVINKIKSLKSQNRFNDTIDSYMQDDTVTDFDYLKLLTKYAESSILACPAHFHRCSNAECPIYQKNAIRDKNRAYYLKRKKARSG